MCHTIPGGHQAGALGGRGSRAHVCLSPCGALWPRQARQGCCPPGHSRTARPGCGSSGREGRARTREAPSLPVRRGREAGGARGPSDASGVEEDACHTLPPTPSRKRSASCGQETPRHKLRTHVARGAGETRLQRKEGPLLGCHPLEFAGLSSRDGPGGPLPSQMSWPWSPGSGSPDSDLSPFRCLSEPAWASSLNKER